MQTSQSLLVQQIPHREAPGITNLKFSQVVWNPRIEALFQQWIEMGQGYRWVHDQASRYYSHWNLLFLMLLIFFNALTSILSIPTYEEDTRVAVLIIGIVSVTTVTIQHKLGLSSKAKAHKDRAAAHQRFYRQLMIIMQLPPTARPSADSVLNTAIRDIDRIGTPVITLPSRVLMRYRERYRDSQIAKIDEAGEIDDKTKLYTTYWDQHVEAPEPVVTYATMNAPQVTFEQPNSSRYATMQRQTEPQNPSAIRGAVREDGYQRGYYDSAHTSFSDEQPISPPPSPTNTYQDLQTGPHYPLLPREPVRTIDPTMYRPIYAPAPAPAHEPPHKPRHGYGSWPRDYSRGPDEVELAVMFDRERYDYV